MKDSNNVTKSIAHTKWNCKYHIVFAPKYRRKVFFESLQKSGFAKLEKSWYGDSVIRRIKRKEIYYKTKLLFMIKVKDKMGKNK